MTTATLNPIDYPEDFDFIVLANVRSPGICKLGDVSRDYDWDVKKGKGTVGSTTTFTGKPPAKLSITFYLWQTSHFTDWERFRSLFKYDPTKKSIDAVDIFHPALADLQITSVVCTGYSAIKHEGKGMYSCSVDFIEYFPAAKQPGTSTPGKSTSNTDPNNPANPNPGNTGNSAVDQSDKEREDALNDLINAYS